MFCDAVRYVTFMFWKLYILELLRCVQLRFVTLRHVTFTLCSNIVSGNVKYQRRKGLTTFQQASRVLLEHQTHWYIDKKIIFNAFCFRSFADREHGAGARAGSLRSPARAHAARVSRLPRRVRTRRNPLHHRSLDIRGLSRQNWWVRFLQKTRYLWPLSCVHSSFCVSLYNLRFLFYLFR